jgi:cell division septation protein DedD
MRIRNNLERKEEYSPTRIEEVMDSDDEPSEESKQEMQDQNPENETEQPDEEPVSAADSTNKEQAESEEPDYVDPEVESEPVPLNLGSEDARQQDSMAAEGNQEPPTEQQETANDQEEPNTSKDQSNEQVDQQQMPPMPTQNNGSIEDYNYFVIGASFRNNENAIEYQQKLEEEGFNAMILSEPDSSFQFVAYGGYITLSEAKSGLSDVREYHNSEAWLLTK